MVDLLDCSGALTDGRGDAFHRAMVYVPRGEHARSAGFKEQGPVAQGPVVEIWAGEEEALESEAGILQQSHERRLPFGPLLAYPTVSCRSCDCQKPG